MDRKENIEYDFPCVVCGYNLRGLPNSGNCPECGVAIGRSQHGNSLAYANPDWLRSVARGVRLIAFSLWALIFCLVMGMVMLVVLTPSTWIHAACSWALVTASLVSALALPVGVTLLTRQEPRCADGEEPDSVRRLIRVGTCLVVGGALWRYCVAPSVMREQVWVVLVSSLVVTTAGCLMYVGGLVARIPDEYAARQLKELWKTLLKTGAVVLGCWIVTKTLASIPAAPQSLSSVARVARGIAALVLFALFVSIPVNLSFAARSLRKEAAASAQHSDTNTPG